LALETHEIGSGAGEHIVRLYEHESELVAALRQACELHSDAIAPPHDVDLAWAAPTFESVLAISLPAEPDAPGRARRQLADALRERGCERGMVDAAALVCSELASNAVRHVGSPFSVSALIGPSTLRIAVQDASPHLLEGAMTVLPTHGLAVVDALCGSWGRERTAGGKVVWAELPL